MIEKPDPFFWEVYCDKCSWDESIDADTCAHFQSLIEYLKEEGWCMRLIKGEWHHFCPYCSS